MTVKDSRFVIELYKEFWVKFSNVIRSDLKGLVYPTSQEPFNFTMQGELREGQCVKMVKPICFRKLDCKKPTPSVDVVVEYEDKIKKIGNKIRIIESKSVVSYFFGGIEKKPISFQSIRFDYHPYEPGCMQSGDPLFHAQFHPDDIMKDTLPEFMKKHWQYSKTVIEPQNYMHVRIPTSRMLLPDILCFIVADHLRDKVHNLIDETRGIIIKFADIIGNNDFNIQKYYHYSSTHKWYCKPSKS